MIMQEAIRLFRQYLQSNHKQRTIDSYVYLLSRFDVNDNLKMTHCDHVKVTHPCLS
jgi:hypothetical protein